MQMKDKKEVAVVRVLARETARELNVQEMEAVGGGLIRPPVDPGTPMGTGTHFMTPDRDYGDPYL